MNRRDSRMCSWGTCLWLAHGHMLSAPKLATGISTSGARLYAARRRVKRGITGWARINGCGGARIGAHSWREES